jgi:predicted lipase
VIIDLRNTLVPYTSPGSSGCAGCMVHQGFQQQWTSVASDVVSQVQSALQVNPEYTIVITGHSLGGALATMAAPTLEAAFPGKVTAYSLASPRVGNPAFAAFVEAAVPQGKLFRLTHTDDTVPQDLTPAEGFAHHGVEYWQSADPAAKENMVMCDGGEDQACNAGHAEPNAGMR